MIDSSSGPGEFHELFCPFSHILGFPTEQLMQGLENKKSAMEHLLQQRAYLHLIHWCVSSWPSFKHNFLPFINPVNPERFVSSQWQWLHGSVDVAVDAFERALGSDLNLDELHTLWME